MSNHIEKLQQYYDFNLNVLLVGKHGVGKTAMIKEVFESKGLILGKSFLYFSASTLDPWTDLVGVPHKVEREGQAILDFIRPEVLSENSEVVAIFFDELNRAAKKVRNAVMELIQFKSINGKVFPNLKVVWGAINPETEEEIYDVEKLDPAQKDRFHIHKEIPYELNTEYFKSVYGSKVTGVVETWWNKLDDKIKNVLSPRRVDYALKLHFMGGNIKDIIPDIAGPTILLAKLQYGPIIEALETFMKKNNKIEAKPYIQNENIFDEAKFFIMQRKDLASFYLPLIREERLISLLAEDASKQIREVIKDKIKAVKTFKENSSFESDFYESVVSTILTTSTNNVLSKEFGSFMDSLNKTLMPKNIKNVDFVSLSILPFPIDRQKHLTDLMAMDISNHSKTQVMTKIYNDDPDKAFSDLCFLHQTIKDEFPMSKFFSKWKIEKFVAVYNICVNAISQNKKYNTSYFTEDAVFTSKIQKYAKHLPYNSNLAIHGVPTND